MNETTDRLAKLRRFAQLAPQDPEVHFALAQELVGEALAEEAAMELHTVISLSPNHLEARKMLDHLQRGGDHGRGDGFSG